MEGFLGIVRMSLMWVACKLGRPSFISQKLPIVCSLILMRLL